MKHIQTAIIKALAKHPQTLQEPKFN
uniref:Uncharacterized protein n=1 Tax=Rhizophora mucronata TaxID=61149 RepID=A0A2P2PNC3_RHIMU